MKDTITVFKVDPNDNVYEVTFDSNLNVVKSILRKDIQSPFRDYFYRKKVIKSKPKKVKKEVLKRMAHKPTVGGRIREMVLAGKSDEEIIDTIKNEIANKIVPPINCPISLYVRDTRNKLKRGKLNPPKTKSAAKPDSEQTSTSAA